MRKFIKKDKIPTVLQITSERLKLKRSTFKFFKEMNPQIQIFKSLYICNLMV